jgi:transcriptional regulator with XRE-family HTH domain
MSYLDITADEQQAFAERLKEFRRKHRLTQHELGAALGVGNFTISSLELMRNRPFPQTVLKLAELEERYRQAEEAEIDELTGTS